LGTGKTDVSVKIQNIVASASIGEAIDLKAVSRAFPEAKYEPEAFLGLVLHLEEPKTTSLLFRSGKMICAGAKSARDIEEAISKTLRRLKDKGIIILLEKPKSEIINVVASASLGGNIDLEKAAYVLGRIIYEPDQFPGAIYRMDDPKVVVLIFASGKFVIVGAKREEEPTRAARRLREILVENGLIYLDG